MTKMNWDQIESNWAAMTRRVRADWTIDRGEGVGHIARRTDQSAMVGADQQKATVQKPSLKLSAE